MPLRNPGTEKNCIKCFLESKPAFLEFDSNNKKKMQCLDPATKPTFAKHIFESGLSSNKAMIFYRKSLSLSEIIVGGSWEPCHLTCKTCNALTDKDCTSCFSGYSLQTNGTCIATPSPPSSSKILILRLEAVKQPLKQSNGIETYSISFGTLEPLQYSSGLTIPTQPESPSPSIKSSLNLEILIQNSQSPQF